MGGDGRRELVSWWEAHVDRPLGRRENPTDLRMAASAVDAPAVEIPDNDVANSRDTDQAVLDALVIAVATADRGSEETALREAIDELAQTGFLPPVRAELLLNDPRRHLDVLDQVQVMLTPSVRNGRRG
ncbi:hypothetical protein N8J89_31190 [Crossiella sp. CA-258035]|uniref:hypothetical protein n=1 Tax=Crossiella sp. CA-258035 TaxID=2981138 RepID=UPI0024BCDF94|nr:hypothetical protein [Crossiella sp. CA-258035]WHT17561.1 hypothetical protein N8J89_31190 [Crossiella sp. CA-258035]